MTYLRPREYDYFSIPDGPECRICRDFISEYPHIEGGKPECLDNDATICRDCCPDDYCARWREEHAEENAS